MQTVDQAVIENWPTLQEVLEDTFIKRLLRCYLADERSEENLDFLEADIETAYKTRFDDLHMLFGAMCAVAEMQLALPGEIKSTIPLKNVLDRRPFI